MKYSPQHLPPRSKKTNATEKGGGGGDEASEK